MNYQDFELKEYASANERLWEASKAFPVLMRKVYVWMSLALAITGFTAYGVTNYVEMIGSDTSDRGPWYPLWSWSNGLTSDTEGGKAFLAMRKCKLKWLPEVVKAKDFDKTWKDYEKEYNNCNPKAFINEAQEEIKNRMQ